MFFQYDLLPCVFYIAANPILKPYFFKNEIEYAKKLFVTFTMCYKMTFVVRAINVLNTFL